MIDVSAEAISIWQNSELVSTELFRAVEEKVSWVPAETVPVLVMVKVGLAGSPKSQPEMKGDAIANTSGGKNAMSNAWGITVASPKMFRTV